MAVWGCDSAELCLVLMVMDCVVCVAAACAFLLCFFWLFCRLIVVASVFRPPPPFLCCPIGCIYKKGVLVTKGVSLGHQG